MRLHKGLLAGSTALGLVIGGAGLASAADAPKIEQRTPVYACEATGFWELPGTDICFKVGGYAKANFIYNSRNFGLANTFSPNSIGSIPNPAIGSRADRLSFHAAESRINFDARSFTEYGTVRAFIEADFFEAFTPNASSYTHNRYALTLRHAYVQVGNLLAGQFWSTFTNFDVFPEAASFSGMDAKSTSRLGQVRWTQQVGNGVSISVALEDPESPATFSGVAGTNTVHRARSEGWPSGVLTLSVRQSWGSVWLGVVGKETVVTNTGIGNPFAAVGAGSSRFGWAAHGSVSVNLPFGNNRSRIYLGGIYSDGAGRYHDAVGSVGDAFWPVFAGQATNVESWGINAGTQLWVTDTVRFNIHGSWNEISNIPGATVLANLGNLTTRTRQLSGNIAWSPVPNLHLIGEVNWGDREFRNGANIDAWQINTSIQRTF